MGIEPTYLAWKASVLPLNYTRKGNIYKENDCLNKQSSVGVTGFEPAASWSQIKRSSQAEPHPVSGYFVIPFASLIRDARPIILHKYHSVNNFFKFLQDSFFLFYFPMQKSFGWFFSRRELHSFSTFRPPLSKHRRRLPPGSRQCSQPMSILYSLKIFVCRSRSNSSSGLSHGLYIKSPYCNKLVFPVRIK